MFNTEQYSCEVLRKYKYKSTKWIGKREINSSGGELVVEIKLI
jgi:hypothetical protein